MNEGLRLTVEFKQDAVAQVIETWAQVKFRILLAYCLVAFCLIILH